MKFFIKQVAMRRVVYATIPIYLWATYLYGWHVWAVAASVMLGCIATEWFFTKRNDKSPISEAVFVTGALLTLSMPPLVPLWIAFIAGMIAILIGKVAFGGFGRNVFNPAIVGRLFVYLAFPIDMQTTWLTPGAFGTNADAIAQATPLVTLRAGDSLPLMDLITGLGQRIGTMGESSIILIVIAAIYLLHTKTANWKLMLSPIIGFLALGYILHGLGLAGTIDPLYGLFSGSFLFVVVFMITEPITAPKKPKSQWIYGILIGSLVVLFRAFSAFPEGVSFAILFGNMCASLLDKWFTAKKKAVKNG